MKNVYILIVHISDVCFVEISLYFLLYSSGKGCLLFVLEVGISPYS